MPAVLWKLVTFFLDRPPSGALDTVEPAVDLFTISELKRVALSGRIEARVRGQIDGLSKKETRDSKPFWEVALADAVGKLTLRAWSDAPAFGLCESLSTGAFLEVAGEFALSSAHGLDARRWTARTLSEEERQQLLGGSTERRERQRAELEFIAQQIDSVADPRLRGLGRLFLAEYGPRFARAAAARHHHHARRGGLLEHVAQMLRSALALASAYPTLHRDLLVVGVLLHDCGKLWENALPQEGFTMAFDERGEMLGHITIGIELVNALWRRLLPGEEAITWAELEPPSEDVRLHLLHLIAAHHGELQFGSPVVPKTPEAWALHYIDNLDAKLEMLAGGYATARHLAPRIQERAWPLPGNLITPLAPLRPSVAEDSSGEGAAAEEEAKDSADPPSHHS